MLNLFISKPKNLLKIAKNKKNYFILESPKDDNSLEKKIFEITRKYLRFNEFIRSFQPKKTTCLFGLKDQFKFLNELIINNKFPNVLYCRETRE